MKTDEEYMRLALDEAKQAFDKDEVPVGAVVVDRNGKVICSAFNQGEHGNNAMAHAELIAMEQAAAKLGQNRLWDCSLYITLEPCAMCAAAIALMRVARIVYGAENAKGGAVVNGVKYFADKSCNHRPEVIGGVLANECGEILSTFFANKR